LGIVMDIIIEIQGFRNVDEKFIPKEVAVVAINATIIGHWIMMPPCPFSDLSERVRRENNWLSRNYHGIEWFDGEANLKYFTLQLREITRQTRYIYTRGQEKARYLCELLSRNVYNLEGISPPFKELPDGEEDGQRCTHHGFRTKAKFLCALRNAYKLKHWLVQNSGNSSFDSSVLDENCSDESGDESGAETDSGIFAITNQNFDVTRNIEACRNNAIKEEEEEEEKEKAQSEQTKSDCSLSDEEKEEKHFPRIDSLDKNRGDINITQTKVFSDNTAIQSTFYENTSTGTSSEKVVNSEFIQTIPLIRTPPTNEFSGNLTCITSSQCQTCGRLSCRQTAEGVDEIDRHHR